MKKRHYGFYAENKMKGKYKTFALIPAITICRDTQVLKDFGWSAWEFYFEWMWFQFSFKIETERIENQTNI